MLSILMDTRLQHSRPEIWGGIECTINRIGNRFRDQLEYSGHYNRENDINEISKLNISALRYPLLWERHQSKEGAAVDWLWAEKRLNQIRDKGITPIVGLLHHGSGPEFTNLLDPRFPEKFATYAEAVAKKFPWVTSYIPINEPLTTARFSGLYGHWYPHRNDAPSFLKALINQLKATVLAMQKIRSINPAAQLIQTEDLTKIHSTPSLQYQADFENERRWLTFDLLSGKLTPAHSLWEYLLTMVDRRDLEFFIDHPCTPDILGLNYYVTSERFLDASIDQYEPWLRGGNGIDAYADTEAVRAGRSIGIAALLTETWERYKTKMAMTEVHIACTGDEQIRWFMEIWNACAEGKAKGIDMKAVTAWSLLGAYDWQSLLTRNEMIYECGAFDVSDGTLKLTELGEAISLLAQNGEFRHSLLGSKGWWHQQQSKELLVF